jgi:hypothetical protein
MIERLEKQKRLTTNQNEWQPLYPDHMGTRLYAPRRSAHASLDTRSGRRRL